MIGPYISMANEHVRFAKHCSISSSLTRCLFVSFSLTAGDILIAMRHPLDEKRIVYTSAIQGQHNKQKQLRCHNTPTTVYSGELRTNFRERNQSPTPCAPQNHFVFLYIRSIHHFAIRVTGQDSADFAPHFRNRKYCPCLGQEQQKRGAYRIAFYPPCGSMVDKTG